MIALFLTPFIAIYASTTTTTTTNPSPQSNSLSDHWVSSWNCFRDELNQKDQDFNNCWMDNAGKILISSEFTGDAIDASRSLGFIERYISSNDSYYLPELRVNSSITNFTTSGSSVSISNQIIELTANNSSSSHYDQLAIGTSYTGITNLAYLGMDRACFGATTAKCNISSSIASQVVEIHDGFSKRSLLEFQGSMYYAYLNATLTQSSPFCE